jgi:hypothetical protein
MEVGLGQPVMLFLVSRTQWINFLGQAFLDRSAIVGRIQNFSANTATDQIERDDIIPGAFQKILKFDGFLGTYTPALSAAGAQGHVVPQCSLLGLIFKTQSAGRAILYAGQTTVALIVYSEI